MTEIAVGPGEPCPECGGEYGQHHHGCKLFVENSRKQWLIDASVGKQFLSLLEDKRPSAIGRFLRELSAKWQQ